MNDNRQTRIEEMQRTYENYLLCKEEAEIVEYTFPLMEDEYAEKN